jgi:hypothetical protein
MRSPALFAPLAATAAVLASLVFVPSAAVAAEVPDPQLRYTFDTVGGGDSLAAGAAIPDTGVREMRTDGVVRNSAVGIVPGVTGAPGDTAIQLIGGRNTADDIAPYIALPNDILDSSDTAVTVSIWAKWDGDANGNCQLIFGLGRSTTKNLISSTSCFGTYGGVSDAPNGEQRVGNGGDNLPRGTWTNVALVFDAAGQSISYYVNGRLDESAGATGDGRGTIAGVPQTIDAALGADGIGGYLGRSFWDDPYYGGAIDDVQIWDRALTAEELRISAATQYAAILASDSVSLGDTARVVADLDLPAMTNAGSAITWASSDTSVIADDGSVTRPAAGSADAQVQLTPTFTLGDQSRTGSPVTVTVLAYAGSPEAEAVLEVADALAARGDLAGDVRGSLSLPSDGVEVGPDFVSDEADEVSITWSSSEPAIISAEDSGTEPDVRRQGVVVRGSSDQRVVLTATLHLGSETRTVERPVTVLAADPVRSDDLEAYIFAYFTGDSVDGEKIRFAVSDGNDALTWQNLNGGAPVIESTLGTRGLRDPFLLRSKEGDRFFLLATDLSVGRSGWGGATDQGSRYLEIWESTDLVNWGQQRHVLVSAPEAGMTWAPEAHYDPTIDAYVVYWTSTLFGDAAHTQPDGNGPQVLSAITRDFVHFSEPKPWIAAADIEGLRANPGLIDTTVLEDDGSYYRFTKGTEATACPSPDIFAERSDRLRPTSKDRVWEKFDTCLARNAGLPEVEGPSAFTSNPGDVNGKRFYVWVDNYGGVGYIPLYTESLAEGEVDWKVPASYSLPASPRHGVTMGITRSERDALLGKWDPAQLVTSIAPVSLEVTPGTQSVRLPATVTATRGAGVSEEPVTWGTPDLTALQQPGDSIEVRGLLNDSSALPAIAVITAVDRTIPAESVAIQASATAVPVDGTATLTAVVTPGGADQDVEWTSSDESVATVDANGEVRAKALGSVVITATAVGGVTSTLSFQVVATEADLLLRYSFDGLDATEAGSRITDVSGRGHDGSIKQTGASTTEGARGTGASDTEGARGAGADRALSLPGGAASSGAAYVTIPTGVIPSGTTDLTASAWVRWNGGATCEWPLSLGSSTNSYLFVSPDCGGTKTGIKVGAVENASNGPALTATRWSQVTVVLSGGNTLTTYVDGVQIAETQTASTADQLAVEGALSGLIGKSQYGPDAYFGGAVDEVRVYGRALDATEVTTLFSRGTLVEPGTPVDPGVPVDPASPGQPGAPVTGNPAHAAGGLAETGVVNLHYWLIGSVLLLMAGAGALVMRRRFLSGRSASSAMTADTGQDAATKGRW